MKRKLAALISLLILSLSLCGCTEQSMTREFGESMELELPANQKLEEISFLGHVFASDKIDIPGDHYIGTIKESRKIRYKYYGVDTSFVGTIFTDLRFNTITDNTPFYVNMTIEQTVKRLETEFYVIFFWIFWIILTGFCVYGFYYADNHWIEN